MIKLRVAILIALIAAMAFFAYSHWPRSHSLSYVTISSSPVISQSNEVSPPAPSSSVVYTSRPSATLIPTLTVTTTPIISATITPRPTPLPTASSGMVSLNFDDGFESMYTYAIPILNRAGLKSTHYIITHFINVSGYVTADQILQMQAEGHEIGAHTQTHPHLSQLTQAQAHTEIFGSKQDLLDLGIHSVTTFAYPYGDYNDSVAAIARAAGFVGVSTTHPGFNDESSSRYELKRYTLDSGTTFNQVKQWIDAAVKNKQWLILTFHRFNDVGNPISITNQTFQQIVDYLVQQKIPVVTTREGVKIWFGK